MKNRISLYKRPLKSSNTSRGGFQVFGRHLSALKSLRIIWITDYNIANIPYTLTVALNNLGHHCDIVQCRKGMYFGFPENIQHFSDDISSDEFLSLIMRADVVILNDMPIGTEYPFAKERNKAHGACNGKFSDGKRIYLMPGLFEGKRVLHYWHGSIFRRRCDWLNNLAKKYNLRQIVSTPDLLLICYNSAWLPQAMNMELLLFDPPPIDDIQVSHSPTTRLIKSTDEFIEAMKVFPGLKIKMISGMRNDLSIKERVSCAVHYDQFSLGVYGVSSIEGLALGQVVIVGTDNVGSVVREYNPFVNMSSVSQFPDAINMAIRICKGPERIDWLKKNRAWVENLHGAMNVAKRFLNIIEVAQCM